MKERCFGVGQLPLFFFFVITIHLCRWSRVSFIPHLVLFVKTPSSYYVKSLHVNASKTFSWPQSSNLLFHIFMNAKTKKLTWLLIQENLLVFTTLFAFIKAVRKNGVCCRRVLNILYISKVLLRDVQLFQTLFFSEKNKAHIYCLKKWTFILVLSENLRKRATCWWLYFALFLLHVVTAVCKHSDFLKRGIESAK